MATSVSRIEKAPQLFEDVDQRDRVSLQGREVHVHVEEERAAFQPLSPRLVARMEAHRKALEELSSAQTALSKAFLFKGSERRRVRDAEAQLEKYKPAEVRVGQSHEAPVVRTRERTVSGSTHPVDTNFHPTSLKPFDLAAEKQKLVREAQDSVVSGRESLESQIAKLESSLKSRYLAGTGLNKAANAEKRQLIDLREQLELYNHDHQPESEWHQLSTRERTLAGRIVERENIQIRARNARTQLNSDINMIGGGIITAVSAVSLYATNYIANMYGYGF